MSFSDSNDCFDIHAYINVYIDKINVMMDELILSEKKRTLKWKQNVDCNKWTQQMFLEVWVSPQNQKECSSKCSSMNEKDDWIMNMNVNRYDVND